MVTDDVYHRSRYSCNIMAAATTLYRTHMWAPRWTHFQTHAQSLVFVLFFSLRSTCARPTSLITATGVSDSSDTERSVTGAHLFISTSSLRIKIFPLSDLLSPNSTCATVLNPQPRLCFLSPQLPPCFYWLFLPQTPSAGKVLGCI